MARNIILEIEMFSSVGRNTAPAALSAPSAPA